MRACAACHGADGRGAPAEQVGFDTPLPDFTDCSFATREPDGDWLAVAHQGGPTRAFSELMPAFGQALTIEQLQRTLDHLRTFCSNDDWPRGELNLPRALFTEKAYPEDEAVYTLDLSLEGEGAVLNEVVYEKRFGARNQFELAIPFGWNELGLPGAAGTAWNGGVGDVALGVKRAMWHSFQKGSIFSLTGEVILPTGDEDDGLGKGTAVFEPFASYGQVLPSGFFIHAQAGLELPFHTDKAEQEAFWRFVLGRSIAAGRWGRTFSPMLEVLAARELESGQPVDWDLVPQVQITLNQRQHVMFNIGVRLPVTDTDVRETRLVFYILWDWFDGGFLEGW